MRVSMSLVLVCVVVAAPGCKRGGAKALGALFGEGAEQGAKHADDFGRIAKNSDELAEESRFANRLAENAEASRVAERAAAKHQEEMVEYFETVQKAVEIGQDLVESNPSAAADKFQDTLDRDAKRDPSQRVTPFIRGVVRSGLGLSLIRAGKKAEAATAIDAAIADAAATEPPESDALLQMARYLKGDFAGAAEAGQKRRRETAGDPEAFDASDLFDVAEILVLAGRPEAREASKEALDLAQGDEARATMGAYAGIASAAAGDVAGAVTTLDAAIAAAEAATTTDLNFQTLGTPFAGPSKWEKCASTWYEAVRAADVGTPKPGYLAGPTKALRACVAKLPKTKATK